MHKINRLKKIHKYIPIIREIAKKEQWAHRQSHTMMLNYSDKIRADSKKGLSTDSIIHACALVRESALRILKERIYDVQLIGALALHDGMVVEMKTGEGKTISSVPTLYINAISGKGVHVVTVNDYLAKRDALWMKEVLQYLHVSSAYINANITTAERQAAYQADITYGTNNEFGFDYLRDNLCRTAKQKVQRGHNFCIIDEADSILIDEARTPLIISGPAEGNIQNYFAINQLAQLMQECEKNDEGEYEEDAGGDYTLNEKNKHVSFNEKGMARIESLLLRQKIISESLYSDQNFEFVHYFTQAIRAQRLYAKDKDYVIKDNKVQIVDEFTGRILSGRRYSDGLHQAIEAKERMPIAQRSRTVATITLQNYFRLYKKIAGMTGTAATEERELGSIYGLQVAVIPTNRPLVRTDHNDLVYASEEKKYAAILADVLELHSKGQPILLGTTTVEKSEILSQLFTKNRLPHTVLNAKNHSTEAEIVAQAGCVGAITIATNMAGRGTDIKLGGDPHFEISDNDRTRTVPEQRSYVDRITAQAKNVRERGGLCVIGTERHDSRRIDNQLRGRSGRQGDPGVSIFYISMDDQLMRLFGDRRKFLKGMMEKGLGDTDALDHPLINKSIAKAQKRVEERNFEIRKHLLEFDDVINEQRSIVYAQRDAILSESSLDARLIATVETVAKRECAEYKRQQDDAELERALSKICHTFLMDRTQFIQKPYPSDYELLIQSICTHSRDDLEKKKQVLGHTQWNFAIMQEYLKQIDFKWQDHLESLDALREAVYLRSYAQKNPLLEYKLEGFSLFDQMIAEIRIMVAARFFAIRIVPNKEIGIKVARTQEHPLSLQHRSFQQFGSMTSSASTSVSTEKQGTVAPHKKVPSSAGIVHAAQKIGRNDPCPCGSGKKYKYCHGQ